MKQRRVRRGEGPAADRFAAARPAAPGDAVFRACADAAPVGIYVTDARGDCTYANQSWLKMAGLTLDEALGQGWTRGLHPDDRDTIGECWYRSAASAGSWGFEYRFADHDGTVTWVYGTAAPLYEDDGRIAGYIGTNIDITGRKGAESAVAEAAERLRAVISAAADGIIVQEASGKITEWNRGAERIFGIPAAEALDQTSLSRDWGTYREDGSPFPGDEHPSMVTLRTGRPCDHIPVAVVRPDGKPRWLTVSTSPIFEPGGDTPTAVVISFSDVTDLRETESALRRAGERYRLLLENANDAVHVFRISREGLGRFLQVNERACEMLGYTRAELLGLPVAAIDVPEQAARAPEILERLWRSGGTVFETEHVTKDGRRIPVEVSASLFELEGAPTILSIARDISERKEAEKALSAAEERFQTVADLTWDWEYWRDVNGTFVYVTPSCERITGYTAADFLANAELLVSITHPDDRAAVEEHYRERQALHDEGCHLEFRIITRSGETRWIGHECRRVFGETGELLGVRGSNRDITVQREAIERLRESEELFRSLFDTMTSGCAIYEVRGDGERGADYIVKDFNAAALRPEGKTRDEVVGRSLADLRPAIDDYGLIPVFRHVWLTGEPAQFPAALYTDDDYANWYENRVFKLADGQIVAIYDDVTERQTAQQALTERAEEIERQRQLLETLLDTIPNPVFYKDADGRYLGCNKAFAELLGISREAILGKTVHDLSPKDLADKYAETDGQLLQQLATQTYEWRLRAADGTERDMIFNKASFPRPDGQVAGVIGVLQDITERKRAEEALRQSAAVLSLAEEAAHVGSWRYDLSTGRATWSDEMFRLFDWDPVDWAGDSWAVLEARVHPDDLPELRQAAAAAISTATPVMVEYRVAHRDGSERIVRGEGMVEHDQSGQPVSLVGYYQDVTERRQAVEQLRAMLQQTVRALGAVGSLRDPYTGDHERRVTLLADAIAAEMGLDDDRREGLRMAGDVHDVGKIGVPAEILSKPGRLSDVEFNLVKQHAQRGYEILQTIDFRWPVAEMVRQHHERLDGSGYPRGLKREDLLLEARILAVADVVEAMASHRPYRAALGIDAALEEIRGGAGARYDADVVAACEKVLAGGTFSIDG